VLALIFGLIWRRRAERSDRMRGGFAFWGVWLLTFGLIFSKASRIPHTAYMASLAPPLAALSAVGVVAASVLGTVTGSVPEPTLARVKELVSSGQLR